MTAMRRAHGCRGIGSDVLPSAAACIASWIRRLKSEPRWIVDASAQAAKAADLILGKGARVSEDATVAEEAA